MNLATRNKIAIVLGILMLKILSLANSKGLLTGGLVKDLADKGLTYQSIKAYVAFDKGSMVVEEFQSHGPTELCSADQMRLEALTFEGGLSEPEPVAPLVLRDDPAEAFFDEGFQGRPFSVGQLSSFFKKAIGYLFGCLHTAKYIVGYARISRVVSVSCDCFIPSEWGRRYSRWFS